MNMGDVVDLLKYKEKQERQLKPEDRARKDYERLQRLETDLFGQPDGMSFLEMIASEAPKGHPDPSIIQTMKNAAYVAGADLAKEKYLDFGQYNPKRYEDFLLESMVYFRTHEEDDMDATHRLVSVARDFYRHQHGLPRALDINSIQSRRRTLFGKATYAIFNYLVEKKLRDLGFKAAEIKWSSISSLPGSSSQASGP